MKSPRKSDKNLPVDIADYYAIKIGPMWRGLKQESAAFWWLCIYFFFEYVRPQSVYPEIDFLPWTQVALVLACITAFSDKSIVWVRNPANVMFVGFYMLVFLSAALAFNKTAAWQYIDIVIVWVVVYFLIINVVNTEKRLFIFILLFLLVNFKMSQHGAYDYAARGFSYAKWGLKGTPGWFSDSGDFGIAMVLYVPPSMAFVLALKKYWSRLKTYIFYLLPLTGVVTIIGTASRGAQLGLLAIGLWFLLKSRNGFKATIAILLVGWVLYSTLPPKMLEEYQSAGEDETSEDRLEHWAFGWDVIKTYPFLGVGYKSWLRYCNYMNPNGLGNKAGCRLPHNTYISAAAGIGIPAFILYVAMIFYMFWQNARTRSLAKQNGNTFLIYIAHGLDGGMVGFMVATIFFTVLFYPVFWVQLALSVALHQITKNKVAETKEISGTVREPD